MLQYKGYGRCSIIMGSTTPTKQRSGGTGGYTEQQLALIKSPAKYAAPPGSASATQKEASAAAAAADAGCTRSQLDAIDMIRQCCEAQLEVLRDSGPGTERLTLFMVKEKIIAMRRALKQAEQEAQKLSEGDAELRRALVEIKASGGVQRVITSFPMVFKLRKDKSIDLTSQKVWNPWRNQRRTEVMRRGRKRFVSFIVVEFDHVHHADEVAALDRQWYAEGSSEWRPPPRSAEELLALCTQRGCVALVLVGKTNTGESVAVGFALGSITDDHRLIHSQQGAARMGYLDSLYVTARERGEGLGKKLVSAFEAVCAHEGCTHIELVADSTEREKILSFYGDKGYAPMFTRMRKELVDFTSAYEEAEQNAAAAKIQAVAKGRAERRANGTAKQRAAEHEKQRAVTLGELKRIAPLKADAAAEGGAGEQVAATSEADDEHANLKGYGGLEHSFYTKRPDRDPDREKIAGTNGRYADA